LDYNEIANLENMPIHWILLYKDLKKIYWEHPEIKIVTIEEMAFEELKRLLSRTKWAITFGEGMDGYFAKRIRSSAIPFSDHNVGFLGDRFKRLPNLYYDHEEMNKSNSEDPGILDDPTRFEELSNRLIELDKQECNDEEYNNANIRRFYLGDHDLL
jgi:hypothetical protein